MRLRQICARAHICKTTRKNFICTPRSSIPQRTELQHFDLGRYLFFKFRVRDLSKQPQAKEHSITESNHSRPSPRELALDEAVHACSQDSAALKTALPSTAGTRVAGTAGNNHQVT